MSTNESSNFNIGKAFVTNNQNSSKLFSKNLNTISGKRENLQILRNTFFGGKPLMTIEKKK